VSTHELGIFTYLWNVAQLAHKNRSAACVLSVCGGAKRVHQLWHGSRDFGIGWHVHESSRICRAYIKPFL
jgi:hypothetical protein